MPQIITPCRYESGKKFYMPAKPIYIMAGLIAAKVKAGDLTKEDAKEQFKTAMKEFRKKNPKKKEKKKEE